MIDILVSAFVLSVILLGIHSYFGIEIIKRVEGRAIGYKRPLR